jgi:hypothetical protein
MNRSILEQAIEQVKSVVGPIGGICVICHRNAPDVPPETEIDIIGTLTPLGVPACRTCFENILIAVGEISQEY